MVSKRAKKPIHEVLGLGFREGAVITLFALALPLPGALAAIIAVLSRLISTLAELVCVGVAYLISGSQARVVQQEQEGAVQEVEQDGVAKEEAEQILAQDDVMKEDVALLIPDGSERQSIEGGVVGD